MSFVVDNMLTHMKLYIQRVELAEESQKGLLHDPLDDDSKCGPLIDAANERATREILRFREQRMGDCHTIWNRAQVILLEEHGIIWFSPAEMNFGTTHFD